MPSFQEISNETFYDFYTSKCIYGLISYSLDNKNDIFFNPTLLAHLKFEKNSVCKQTNAALLRDFNHNNTKALKLLNSQGNYIFFEYETLTFNSKYYIACVNKTNDNSIDKRLTRYENILDGTSIGTWEWNVQTGEVIISKEWAKILGYTIKELEPIDESIWKQLAHPDDYKLCNKLFSKHFSGETEIYSSEARMRSKDGSWIWVFDKGKVVSWKNGNPEWMTGFHREITQDKLAKEIQETFIEQSPEAIAMFDSQMKYLATSNKWMEEYNLDESIIGKCHYDLFNIPQKWKEIHKKALLGETLSCDEDQYIDQKGEISYLKWHVKPWFTRKNEIGGILLQTSNLTEIKYLQKRRFETKQLLNTVFDAMEVGVAVCNNQGHITFFNKIAQSWHSNKPSNIDRSEISKFYGYYDYATKSILKENELPILQSLAGHSVNNKLMLIKNSNGKRVVRLKGGQLLNNEGNVNGAVITMYDITEDLKSKEKIRVSEETFRGSFEHAANGMALVSTKGEWIKVNQQICSIFGYTEYELSQLTFQDITLEEDLNKDLEYFNKLLNNETDNYRIEKRYVHKNGNIINAILSVSIVRDSFQKPLFFVSQILDVTDFVNSKTALEEVLNITKNQNERLKNFAHIVSHNLRSHSSNFEMLLSLFLDSKPELKDDEYLEMLISASEQLGDTIFHLNEVAAVNTVRKLELQNLNLLVYLQNTIDNLSAIIKENGVQISINIVDQQISVLAIPAYLESILLNFITNAIKYRSKDKIPEISFTTREENDYTILSIRDNGLGIDLQKYGSKLFGMYKTFHKNADSRGIGLFITRNQIEAIGGKVNVESVIKQGTTFSIYFKSGEKITV